MYETMWNFYLNNKNLVYHQSTPNMFKEPSRFELLHRTPKRKIPKKMNFEELKEFIKNDNIFFKMKNLKIK